jgi:hypothetical protein
VLRVRYGGPPEPPTADSATTATVSWTQYIQLKIFTGQNFTESDCVNLRKKFSTKLMTAGNEIGKKFLLVKISGSV